MIRVALLFLITTTVAATSCEPTLDNCTAGCWSKEVFSNGVRICTPVGEGYYSPHNDNNRYGCVGGTYSNVKEAERCSICKAGSISPPRRAECFLCPKGSYQDNPGQSICMSCSYSDGGYDGYGSNAITSEGLCNLIDVYPSAVPSQFPTTTASSIPTNTLSATPSVLPTSGMPSQEPTSVPSFNPTDLPTNILSASPTFVPSEEPSTSPTTQEPTSVPSFNPTYLPTNTLSASPTFVPSEEPSTPPTTMPKSKHFMFWGEHTPTHVILVVIFLFILLLVVVMIMAACCCVLCFGMLSREESVEIIPGEEGKNIEIPVATVINEVIEAELDKTIVEKENIV